MRLFYWIGFSINFFKWKIGQGLRPPVRVRRICWGFFLLWVLVLCYGLKERRQRWWFCSRVDIKASKPSRVDIKASKPSRVDIKASKPSRVDIMGSKPITPLCTRRIVLLLGATMCWIPYSC